MLVAGVSGFPYDVVSSSSDLGVFFSLLVSVCEVRPGYSQTFLPFTDILFAQ